MASRKSCWKSKTVWLGVVEIAAGALVLVGESGLVSERPGAVLLVAAGVLTIVFRVLSDGPVTRPFGPRPEGRRDPHS